MPEKKQRPSRLGRGLSSLMSGPVEVQAAPIKPAAVENTPSGESVDKHAEQKDSVRQAQDDSGFKHLSISAIEPNRHQPRQRFDPIAIRSLAQSILSEGVMQPIVVRPRAGKKKQFEIIAGERRWRAAQEAGLKEIPAVVRDISDEKAAEWALIENLQREDLNPIEKAEAFQRLGDQFGLSHSEIAKRVGLERSSVSNLLRLLYLSDFVRDMIRESLLSMGQARAIAGLEDPAQQRGLAERAVREGLSVRQVEAEAKRLQSGGATQSPSKTASVSPVLSDMEKQIGQQLGTKVKIKTGRKKGAGTLSIEFYSLDQFDALMGRLDVKAD